MALDNNKKIFNQRVGDVLKGGTVAWSLQKKAQEVRNRNTRYYNFWKFLGSFVAEDLVSKGIETAKKWGDRYVKYTSETVDEDKEFEKIKNSLETLEKLDGISPKYATAKKINPGIKLTTTEGKWIEAELNRLDSEKNSDGKTNKLRNVKELDNIKARALRFYLHSVEVAAGEEYTSLKELPKDDNNAKYDLKNEIDKAITSLNAVPAGESQKEKFIREQTRKALQKYKAPKPLEIKITKDQNTKISTALGTLDKGSAIDKIKARAIRYYLRNVEFEFSEQYESLTAADKKAVDDAITSLDTKPSGENEDQKIIRELTRDALTYYKNASKDVVSETKDVLLKRMISIADKINNQDKLTKNSKNWATAKDILDTVEDVNLIIKNLFDKMIAYGEGKNELLLQMLETQASDAGPTSETMDIITNILANDKYADSLDWEEISKIDSELMQKKDLVDKNKDFLKEIMALNAKELKNIFEPSGLSSFEDAWILINKIRVFTGRLGITDVIPFKTLTSDTYLNINKIAGEIISTEYKDDVYFKSFEEKIKAYEGDSNAEAAAAAVFNAYFKINATTLIKMSEAIFRGVELEKGLMNSFMKSLGSAKTDDPIKKFTQYSFYKHHTNLIFNYFLSHTSEFADPGEKVLTNLKAIIDNLTVNDSGPNKDKIKDIEVLKEYNQAEAKLLIGTENQVFKNYFSIKEGDLPKITPAFMLRFFKVILPKVTTPLPTTVAYSSKLKHVNYLAYIFVKKTNTDGKYELKSAERDTVANQLKKIINELDDSNIATMAVYTSEQVFDTLTEKTVAKAKELIGS
jgi:hypothetical protein